ncbi:MAG: hypothetical protein ACRECZ_07505, partial [Methylocella sp.]
PYITRQRYPSEQEGEAYRRNLARLKEAEQAVRDAENQGLEQQRIAAKALEDAEREFKKQYQPDARPLLN